MIPQSGHLAALPDRNALIVIDRAANIRRIVEVLKILQSLPKVAAPEPQKTP
jgi:hypothetical protein